MDFAIVYSAMSRNPFSAFIQNWWVKWKWSFFNIWLFNRVRSVTSIRDPMISQDYCFSKGWWYSSKLGVNLFNKTLFKVFAESFLDEAYDFKLRCIFSISFNIIVQCFETSFVIKLRESSNFSLISSQFKVRFLSCFEISHLFYFKVMFLPSRVSKSHW